MVDFNDDDLHEMSDEDLEKAFKEAKASLDNDEVDEVEDSVDSDDEEVVDADDEELDEDLEDDDVEVGEDSEDDEELDEDDSEQPEEDSDHDASDEDEDTEDDEEDAEETDEDDPDGDSEEEDEAEPTEEEEESEPEPQQAQQLTFKANGQEYKFTEKEIKDQFPRIFGQAMDYTKKMQAIKPYRKTIDAIEQAELKHEDINLMIDVLKGDKTAFAEVLKRTGIDALDLDSEESKYVAKDYGRDEKALELDDVLNDIYKDAEYATTSNILGKQWDDASWKEMSSNPQMIKQLHIDVQSGMYDTIAPIMNKLKVFDGATKSDLEYYKEAAKVYFGEKQAEEKAQKEKEESDRLAKLEADKAKEEADRLEEIRKQETKRKATKKASSKRKAAAPTRTKAATNKVIDYLDEDDKDFDEWYNKLQSEM